MQHKKIKNKKIYFLPGVLQQDSQTSLQYLQTETNTHLAMDTVEKVYERFGSRIMGGKIKGNPDEEFCIFCKREKVSPVSFNAFLREELGMSGPEIWYCFQKLLNL